MKVLLTFDVEVWCNGWHDLDARFPAAYERYVFGRSPEGEWALPKTLEILDRHSLKAVFFVEPLFAARFGLRYLEQIVGLIRNAGQDVQLHLHPEWADEPSPPLLPGHNTKRQHLNHYTRDEQTALLAHGLRLMVEAGAVRPTAFRAGSFACNRDTYRALAANGIRIDSSLNACYAVSGPDLRIERLHDGPALIEGVFSEPVSVFVDGLGRPRPAQIAGCGFGELRQALSKARDNGAARFVMVSHNFEMLRPGSARPDPVVVRRFDLLCAFLAQRAGDMPTATFADEPPLRTRGAAPAVGLGPTARRLAEQAWRRRYV